MDRDELARVTTLLPHEKTYAALDQRTIIRVPC
jgi:hypothetical protein